MGRLGGMVRRAELATLTRATSSSSCNVTVYHDNLKYSAAQAKLVLDAARNDFGQQPKKPRAEFGAHGELRPQERAVDGVHIDLASSAHTRPPHDRIVGNHRRRRPLRVDETNLPNNLKIRPPLTPFQPDVAPTSSGPAYQLLFQLEQCRR